jgi:hypothetical protein
MEKVEKDKLEFEKALELRNFEISNFWKRGWFFGALLLAIFSGYYKLKTMPDPIIYPICLSFIALLISLIQSLMVRGSKYWQERWEYKTKNKESALGIDLTKTKRYGDTERYYIDASIRAKDENCYTQAHKISVSKLTFLIWDIITISCLFLWISDVLSISAIKISIKSIHPDLWLTIKVVTFHTLIIIYIVRFLYKGQVFEKLLKKIDDKNNIDQTSNKYYSDSEKYTNLE